jgi:transcription elongation factor GreA
MEEFDIESGATILLTPEGHERLTAELAHLTKEKRAEIAERIRESIDHGEFSEDNSELDEVKQEQAFIENRISDLKAILASAELMDPAAIPTKHVGLGSRVTVHDVERDVKFEVRIVASVEANPDEDLISEESPMGQALMGLQKGDKATFQAPAGTITYEVVKIGR